MVKWNEVPPQRLEAMADAGGRILECYRVMHKTEANVVGEVLRGQGEFFEWDHYPPGDVYDDETYSQYYYHAHPPENRAHKWGEEHGHFHTFLREKGIPSGLKPIVQSAAPFMEERDDTLSHLIGISMNQAGFPIRLFTTNRWVTADNWYAADDVIAMLDLYDIDLVYPSWPVNIWLTAMVCLFRPQIEELVRQRDVTVADWMERHPDIDTFEDRGLEITSIKDISVEKQIKAVDKALRVATA